MWLKAYSKHSKAGCAEHKLKFQEAEHLQIVRTFFTKEIRIIWSTLEKNGSNSFQQHFLPQDQNAFFTRWNQLQENSRKGLMFAIPLHGSTLEDNCHKMITCFDWQSYWVKPSFCFVYTKRALAKSEKIVFNMSNTVLIFYLFIFKLWSYWFKRMFTMIKCTLCEYKCLLTTQSYYV